MKNSHRILLITVSVFLLYLISITSGNEPPYEAVDTYVALQKWKESNELQEPLWYIYIPAILLLIANIYITIKLWNWQPKEVQN